MKISLVSNFGVKPSFNAFNKKTALKSQNFDEVDFKSPNIQNEEKAKIKKTSIKSKLKTFFAALLSSLATAGVLILAFTKKTNDLKAQNNELSEKLKNLVLPEDYDVMVENKIKQINERNLSYSPTKPPVDTYVLNTVFNTNPIIELPKNSEKTSNRKDSVKITYPEFRSNKPYKFKFPESKDISITKEHMEITPIKETLTTISESYADSLKWDNNKIARDLMQNFYDGHGQTLDGVKVTMNPTEKGDYIVRIEGKSTYLPDKAILLGESSKKDNDKAAGNYGEGLKMVVLKLLREKGADNVKIASDNWNVDWSIKSSELGKNVLAYKLGQAEPIDGNYIEFNTNDEDFMKAIIDSFDRFYHYNNTSFKCPDFENDKLSVQLLPNEHDKGQFYIAGQAFEVGGKYENLGGMNINIKCRPPKDFHGRLIFDPSRDRVSLNDDNMEDLGRWIISEDNMSREDAVKLINSIKQYWDVGVEIFGHTTNGASFMFGLVKGASERNDLKLKFPDDKYVADHMFVSGDLKDMYRQAGYKICNSRFAAIGMPSLKSIIEEARKHKPIEPTQTEKNKILILKDAIQLLAPVLKEDDFLTEEELDTKILIYNKDSKLEDKAYKNVEGEAILFDKHSVGFWLDKSYMEKADFADAFSTALHELTHKFGGDESAVFSYKLTNVLQKVFAAIEDNPNLAVQFKILEAAWNAQK